MEGGPQVFSPSVKHSFCEGLGLSPSPSPTPYGSPKNTIDKITEDLYEGNIVEAPTLSSGSEENGEYLQLSSDEMAAAIARFKEEIRMKDESYNQQRKLITVLEDENDLLKLEIKYVASTHDTEVARLKKEIKMEENDYLDFKEALSKELEKYNKLCERANEFSSIQLRQIVEADRKL